MIHSGIKQVFMTESLNNSFKRLHKYTDSLRNMQQLILLCLKVFSFVVHNIAEVSKSAILCIKCMLLNINFLFIELGLSSYITHTIMFWSEYQLD